MSSFTSQANMCSQTGGVTLTLSLAYLSVVLHQRNREQQGHSLRAQALAIQNLIDPIPQPLPPSRSEVAASKRAETLEVAKDRWNDEVENAARWVQRTDWHEVREGLEDRIGALWDKAFGESVADSADRARTEASDAATKAKSRADSAAGSILSRARGTAARAKESTEDFGAKVEEKALQARLATWREEQHAANLARTKAQEAQDAASSAASSAAEKAKDKTTGVVEKVKSAIGLAGAGAVSPAGPLTDVQKVLDQRFSGAQDRRTVAQVLKERYMPLDKQESNVLRGL